MDLISRQALKQALEDEIRLRIAIQQNRSHNDQIMADIRWIMKIVDEMPSVYKVPLELKEEEKSKMQTIVAFMRKSESEMPVAKQLDSYIRVNKMRVAGFQMVKEKPGAVEEYLLAVVEPDVTKYLIRENGDAEALL